MNEVLTHRNYKKMAENNLEFIRGDIWDIDINSVDGWPSALYNPGEEIFMMRLQTVNITIQDQPKANSKDIQGMHLEQNFGRDSCNGVVTFTWQDKEDQAITFMLNDALNQIGDPDTGFGRHKKELNFNFKVNFYNTLLQKIRYYDCDTGIINNCTIPDAPTVKGGDLSNCQMIINFQQIKRKII